MGCYERYNVMISCMQNSAAILKLNPSFRDNLEAVVVGSKTLSIRLIFLQTLLPITFWKHQKIYFECTSPVTLQE